MKGVRSSNKKNNTSYTEKYQKHIPCSFAYKEEKNAASKPIELILEEYDYCKKSDKKAFW